MRPVAERLVGRLTAAAEGNHGASSQAERGSGGIQDLEVAFNADGSVVQDYNFSWHHRDGSTSTFWGLRSGVKTPHQSGCGRKPIPFSDTREAETPLPNPSVPAVHVTTPLLILKPLIQWAKFSGSCGDRLIPECVPSAPLYNCPCQPL